MSIYSARKPTAAIFLSIGLLVIPCNLCETIQMAKNLLSKLESCPFKIKVKRLQIAQFSHSDDKFCLSVSC